LGIYGVIRDPPNPPKMGEWLPSYEICVKLIFKMNTVYLSLGSNLGNRMKYLDDALVLIEEKIGKIVKRSSVYETEPWGIRDQSMFLNMAVCVTTNLTAVLLLETILEIEQKLGRIRIAKWYERIIDIDILFYNNMIINEDDLIIPHPYLQERKFVLEPLVEIAPDFIHPVLKITVKELLLKCTDNSTTKKYSAIEPSV
jgi:2-amino-4-hydroxy-6-hydroxymethyldihydropteridine diphosphokinase